MSIAVRASGYINIRPDVDHQKSWEMIRLINNAYRDIDVEGYRQAVIKIDIFGQNEIDYKPLEKILKSNKEIIEEEVVINEWVETDGGLYFDPDEDED